jgi:acyl-CoA synthetase (NDP forming)
MAIHPLEEILHPKSIAIVGASARYRSQGHRFTRSLLEHGYKGETYLVNPKYSEILGIKVYSSLGDIPWSVDYVISVVPASEVLDMLDDCSQKGVKCVHLYTARFSETGRPEAAELEQRVLERAKEKGIRLVGPNCMGLYDPRQGISWSEGLPGEGGAVGLAFQSSSAAEQFVKLASPRGIRFSKVIGYGNALDFNESDFLEYLSHDPETKLILMYVEGVKDGKRFFNTLRQAVSTKPVIIIKAGRGKAGARAVHSHTANLAGSMKIWEALVTQAGAVSARDLSELIDLAVTFNFLPPIRGGRVGIAGGAGGATVLGADQCEEAGLDVVPLPMEIREELKSQGIPIWDWIGNPADTSITGSVDWSAGDTLQMMAQNQNFDLLIAILGAPRMGRQPSDVVTKHLEWYKVKEINQKPLLAVVEDKTLDINAYEDPACKLTCEMRAQLISANIPFYPTMERAARAARKLIDYYQKRKNTRI